MAKSRVSAGLLIYRRDEGGLQVLLVHPGCPFFRNKDEGTWTIPKGEVEPGEDPLAAAVREFGEEIGSAPTGPYLPLAPVKQKGGKVVHAWAVEADVDPACCVSNAFTIEWPPGSGRQQAFPEIDRAAWFPIDEARRRILRGQAALLDNLVQATGSP